MLIATKLTDAAALALDYCTIQYSTRCPFNCNNSRILVLEPQSFALYDVHSTTRLYALPWLGDSNEPLWDRRDPDVFYYRVRNQLRSFNVVSEFAETLHSFGRYQEITFSGEADLSEDGDHIVCLGDRREVLLYQISTNTPGAPVLQGGVDGLTVTPDNHILISGETGIWLHREGYAPRRITARNGHKSVMRDTDGSEVMVWIDDTDNVVKKVSLSHPEVRTPLLALPWSMACHISCPARGEFALISTYPSGEEPYGNAILRVPLDGSQAEVLLKHGGTVTDYNSQPRASIDAQGQCFAYNSNQSGRIDVYMAALAKPESPGIVAERFAAWHAWLSKILNFIFFRRG